MKETSDSRVMLEDIAERIEVDDRTKLDFSVRGKDVFIDREGVLKRKEYPGRSGLRFSEYAMTQLLNRYDLDVRGMKKRLKGDEQDKAIKELNELLGEDDKEMFIRARNFNGRGILRAVLSGDYVKIDNKDVVGRLVEGFEGAGVDGRVQGFFMRDDKMHLRVVFDGSERAFGGTIIGPDDIIKTGIDIINSEVGRSSIRIEPLVYRLVCKNGLKMWSVDEDNKVRQRHIFVSAGELNRLIGEGIDAGVRKAEGVAQKFEESKKIKVVEPIKVIEGLCEEKKMPLKDRELVVNSYYEEPVSSRFGVVNAFTRGARHVGCDKRLGMESFAGRVLYDDELFYGVVAKAV